MLSDRGLRTSRVNLRLGDDRLRLCRLYLLNNCRPHVALRRLGLLTRLLVLNALLLYQLQLLPMHSVNLVKARIDLVNCDVPMVIFVDDSENRLVLLLVNSELFLHFESCLRQQSRGCRFFYRLRFEGCCE